MTSATATADENYDDLEDDGGLSGFWILIIFLIVLAAFGSIMVIAYQKGAASRSLAEPAVPLVMADPTPARTDVAPTASTDLASSEAAAELENPRNTRIAASVPQDDPLDGFTTTPADEQPSTPAPEPVRTAQVEEPQSQVTQSPATSGLTPEPTTRQTPPPPSQRPTDPVRTAAAEPVSTPAPTPQRPEPRPAPTTNNRGTHAVQVGAFGSSDEAMETYGRLTQSLGALVANQQPEVRTVTVRGQVYHRLWLGPFNNRADATAYCQQLSARGQDCYVQSR